MSVRHLPRRWGGYAPEAAGGVPVAEVRRRVAGGGESEAGEEQRRTERALLESIESRIHAGVASERERVAAAVLVLRLGDEQRAATMFSELHRTTDSAMPSAFLARMKSTSGDLVEARRLYRESLRRELTPMAATGLASLLVREGEHEAALGLLGRLPEADMADGSVVLAKAGAATALGRHSLMEQLVESALRMGAEDAAFWVSASRVAREGGAPRLALRGAIGGLRLHPDSRKLRAELARTLIDCGKRRCGAKFAEQLEIE